MIQKFINRTPTSLDAVYGIEGAQSRTNKLDLGPIRLVHDVSREAQLAQGFFAEFSQQLATAGAGVRVFSALGVETLVGAQGADGAVSEMSARNLDPSEVDVWVLGIALSMAAGDAGNFGAGASAACGYETGAFSTRQVGLSFWSGADSTEQTIAAAGRIHLARFTNIANTFGSRVLPCRLPRGGRILSALQDDAAGPIVDGRFNWSLWIGPRDTAPIL